MKKLILLLFIPLVSFGQSSDDYFEIGNLKFSEKKYFEAIENYSKVIELSRGDKEAFFNRAAAKVELKDYEGAILDYKKAIKLDSKYVAAYVNMGIVKKRLKNYKDAIKDFDKAIEIDSGYKLAYYNKADLMLNQSREINLNASPSSYFLIIKYLTKAIELDDKYAPAYLNRGIAYARLSTFNIYDENQKKSKLKSARSDLSFAIALLDSSKYSKDIFIAYTNRSAANTMLASFDFAQGFTLEGAKNARFACEDATKAKELSKNYSIVQQSPYWEDNEEIVIKMNSQLNQLYELNCLD